MCCRNLMLLGDDVVSLEGQAIFCALLTATRMGYKSLVVETDCDVLFQALCVVMFLIHIGPLPLLLVIFFIYVIVLLSVVSIWCHVFANRVVD